MEITVSADDDYLDQVLKFSVMDDDAFEMAKDELQDASEQLDQMMSAWMHAKAHRNETGN